VRVIECNFCGELIQAANDDDLRAAAAGHMEAQHGEAQVDEGQVRDMVERDAYDATDS
jgi:predicted small metal-binding protein